MGFTRTLLAVAILDASLCVPLALSRETEKLAVIHGPYLQAVTDSSVVIMWFTNRPCVSNVEYLPIDSNEAKTALSSHHGLIDANERMHKVALTGLTPGRVYRYRVISKEIVKFDPYSVTYGATVTAGPYRLKTWDPRKEEFSFSVVNDIHEKPDVLKGLLDRVPWEKTDLIVFNGDMFNYWTQEEQAFKGFLDVCVERFARETPFIFARGNHDTRGALARKLIDYFPTATGEYYFSFQHGPARFLVLDAGEDKVDSHKEYSGLVDFDAFRAKETEWLKKTVEDSAFKASRYRILLVHMPLYGVSGYGIKQARSLWSPILNKADIDLAISAHTHRFARLDPNVPANPYPIVINAPDSLVTVDIRKDQLNVMVRKADGTVTDNMTLKAHRD